MGSIYDATNIDSLPWPDTEEGDYAKLFLKPLIKNGLPHYFHNLNAEIYALKGDDFVFPLVVASENYDNSYVCSPYGHYISYGKEALGLIKNPVLSKTIGKMLHCMEKFVRVGAINSVVYVNHSLFSTDIYPKEFKATHIPEITNLLKKRFPKHAICFRSLNHATTPFLNRGLHFAGFRSIVCREIFLTDTKDDPIFQTRILKSDLKFFRDKKYEVTTEKEISAADCKQILSLYESLYIHGHSKLHPQPKLPFIELMLKNRLYRFIIIRNAGKIEGVAAFFERSGTLMCPFLGMDKQHPDHTGIYRLLSIALLLEARKKGLLFHQGAGASFYKKLRRAKSQMELMAVYTDHLLLKQRASWSLLLSFINLIAPRYIKKY